ncbi:hypothetical protein ACFY12_34230 [Streptomyces sp. NPDC001339]|uniref:hypothetical protein n=1 Tax=Streptomyces sp. NPDC001339 TaxID=3364563 RepID=UPI0036CF1882
MPLHLTADRDLAKKVTALATDADDARDLLLALGVAVETEDDEPELAVEPGSSYVPPAKRRIAWTRMAGEMNAAGRTTAEIALALAISEDLAAELVGDWWAGVGR